MIPGGGLTSDVDRVREHLPRTRLQAALEPERHSWPHGGCVAAHVHHHVPVSRPGHHHARPPG